MRDDSVTYCSLEEMLLSMKSIISGKNKQTKKIAVSISGSHIENNWKLGSAKKISTFDLMIKFNFLVSK